MAAPLVAIMTMHTAIIVPVLLLSALPGDGEEAVIRAAIERAGIKRLERDRMLGTSLGPSASRGERHRTALLAQHLRNASWGSFFGPTTLLPSFDCPVDLIKTASVAERWDGGKWLCGLSLLDPGASSGCTVYSVGSNFDASFERYVQQMVGKAHPGQRCDIHTFDPTLDPKPRAQRFGEKLEREGVSKLHLIGLRSDDTREHPPFPARTLRQLMTELGHSCVDIVKIDIEGGEHTLLASTHWENLCIGMLLFELHGHPTALPPWHRWLSIGDVASYFHELEQAGFGHYAMEIVGPPTGFRGAERLTGAAEIAFINTSWLLARAGQAGRTEQRRQAKAATLTITHASAPFVQGAGSHHGRSRIHENSDESAVAEGSIGASAGGRQPQRKRGTYRVKGECPHPCASNTVVTAFFDLGGFRDTRSAYLTAFRRLLSALPRDLRMVAYCDSGTCTSLKAFVKPGQQVVFRKRDWRGEGPISALRKQIKSALGAMGRNASRPKMGEKTLLKLATGTQAPLLRHPFSSFPFSLPASRRLLFSPAHVGFLCYGCFLPATSRLALCSSSLPLLG